MLTDGVHRRELDVAGPVVLKVVSVTGAALSGSLLWSDFCASLFLPHPLFSWYNRHVINVPYGYRKYYRRQGVELATRIITLL